MSSNQTKFILDADAAKAVQEFLRFRDAEKKTEDGIKSLAGSARSSETAVVGAVKSMAREYELAGERINRAIPLPRTFGGSFVPRGRNVAGFDLKALPSSLLRGPAGTIPNASGAYGMASDTAAAGNLAAMDSLLGRGNRMMADSAVRQQLDFERRTRNVELSAAKQQRAQERLWNGLTVGLTAAGVAVAGASAATQRYIEDLDNIGAAGKQLEADITPLLSLGGNSKNTAGIRGNVLGMSGAYGLDAASVSSALFMLQSNAANLGSAGQKDIFTAGVGLNRVAGGDLKTDLVAVTKLMENYGQSMGTAQVAAAKLLQTEDQAAITMDELSSLLPDVLPAAKMLGLTYDEVAASVITATQVMGRNEKTLTGLRNMFLKMGEAQQQGLVHQGRLIDQLQELQKVDPMVLEKFFGERTVSVVSALAEKTADVAKNLQTMEKVAGSEVMGKFLDRMADAGSRDASTLKILDQDLGNVNALRYQDPATRDKEMRTKFARLGYELSASPLQNAVTPDWAKNLWIANAGRMSEEDAKNGGGPLGLSYPGKDWVQLGLNQTIKDLYTAGDAQSIFEANKLKLQFGTESGATINGRSTDEHDAQAYADLDRKMHGNLAYKDFVQYEEMVERHSPGAAGFLAQLQKRADQRKAQSIRYDAGQSQLDQFGKYVDKFGEAVDALAQGARDPNAHNH